LSSQEARIRKEDYSVLLLELQQEILQCLRLFEDDIAISGRDYNLQ
jgi:hypothetical protein